MAHLKRQEIPKSWPIARKGTTYIVVPNSEFEKGIPILIVLRDILKVVETQKELKQAIHKKNILVNTKQLHDEKLPVVLFDTITLLPTKTSYRTEMSENGKFEFKKIKETEAGNKISKITNKKILKEKKVQLNFSDGRNVLEDKKNDYKINDSAIINLTNGKIEGIIPLKEKAEILIFSGKHAGEKGKIVSIDEENKIAEIESDGKNISVLIKYIMALK